MKTEDEALKFASISLLAPYTFICPNLVDHAVSLSNFNSISLHILESKSHPDEDTSSKGFIAF